MFSLTVSKNYYLYAYSTDMRLDLYTLSRMVTNLMGRNIQGSDVFIFINKSCTSMKIMHMELGGLVIDYMKLESGNFTLSCLDENSNKFQISWQDLMTITQGVSRGEKPYKKRWKNI